MFTKNLQLKPNFVSGFALVDALIGLTVAIILCTALISSVTNANINRPFARDQLTASLTLLEVYEVVVSLAQTDFTAVHASDCYTDVCHVVINAGSWEIAAGSELIDGRFERSFKLATVERDAVNGDITTSGGATDPKTLEMEINVDWTTKDKALSEKVVTYIHDTN